MKMLLINIGGTSSKLALFQDYKAIMGETIRHTPEDLKKFPDLWDQYNFRKEAVIECCNRNGINIEDMDAIVSRGPSVKPLQAGVYGITQEMIEDAQSKRYGNHPCALGCKIALELTGSAKKAIEALTVDPPCVDEMIPVAKYTGLPEIKRKSFFQALNHKAVAKRLAKQLGKKYDEMNIVISHLGSGISVASHSYGKVIDVTNGLDGDAPFGLDRLGTLPTADWMKLCMSGKYSQEQLHNMINGGGGVMAYLGTNSAFEVEKMIENGDTKAAEVYDAMAFQIAKGVGAACAIFGKKPDAIIFTGGLANSQLFTNKLKEKVGWITDVYIFAGEDEMLALAEGALRVFNKEEELLIY